MQHWLESVIVNLKSALSSFPESSQWLLSFLLLLAYLMVAFPLALCAGFVKTSPQASGGLVLRLAATTFFMPALAEELFFRGLLFPVPQTLSTSVIIMMLIALFLYVLAHPLGAWLFRPQTRKVFYNPIFLFLTLLLGVTCGYLYWTTASLWPAVVVHWLVVWAWLSFGGYQTLHA